MEDMAGVTGDGLEMTLLGGVAREAVVDFFDFLGVDFGVVFGVMKGELLIGAGPRLIGQVIVYVGKNESERIRSRLEMLLIK